MTAFEKIVEKYPKEKRYTLAIMQDIQKENKYIPKEYLSMLSEYLEVPMSKLYGMATFYKALSLTPKGEYIITVCDGTACHVRSSAVLTDELQKALKIKPGETTKDGKFTLQTVNCLGSCAIAPVMMVNEKYYGKVTPNVLRDILKEYGGDSIE
ncbi:MAG: NADH-quinone oxidoreductase subunit NuoE [Clostridiaceae bacterium]